MFISIKKWLQTNYLGAAAQLTVESVKNTRSAAPNPPCCEILVSKDCSKLAERKFRQSCEIQVDFFVFISIKKWLQTNYLGAAAQLTSNSDARLHFDTLSLLRPLPKSGPRILGIGLCLFYPYSLLHKKSRGVYLRTEKV